MAVAARAQAAVAAHPQQRSNQRQLDPRPGCTANQGANRTANANQGANRNANANQNVNRNTNVNNNQNVNRNTNVNNNQTSTSIATST